MPPGAVADQASMRARPHLRADLLQVFVHCLGIGGGHDDGGTHATVWADRAKQIDRIVTIIPYRGGPRADWCPNVGDPSLLAHPGLVLKPDFDRRAGGGGEQ